MALHGVGAAGVAALQTALQCTALHYCGVECVYIIADCLDFLALLPFTVAFLPVRQRRHPSFGLFGAVTFVACAVFYSICSEPWSAMCCAL